jgi:hypothetical protein
MLCEDMCVFFILLLACFPMCVSENRVDKSVHLFNMYVPEREGGEVRSRVFFPA